MEIIQNKLRFLLNEKDKTAAVIGYASMDDAYIIPHSAEYNNEKYIITAISDYAFQYSSITSISFPSDSEVSVIGKFAFYFSTINKIDFPTNLLLIDENAFKDCNKIKIIQFPPNCKLQTIGKSAFSSSNIEKIYFPLHLTRICESALSNCFDLKIAEFPEDSELKTIEKQAFKNTEIVNIFVPSEVDDLQDGWCQSTHQITNFKVDPKNKRYKKYENDFIIGKSDIKSDTYDTLVFARRDITSAQIPPFIRVIGAQAFEYCSQIQKIDFPPNSELRTIKEDGLSYVKLPRIDLPAKLEFLEDGWCVGSRLLDDFEVDQANERYKKYENDFIIGKSDVKSDIYDILVFARRKITSAQIPSFIRVIGAFAFENCRHLQSVETPDDSQLERIEQFAFFSTQIESINLPHHLTTISSHAFESCRQLSRVIIPQNSQLRTISNSAFSRTSLTEINLPESLEKIDASAFASCSRLRTMVFPEHQEIKSIGEFAFDGSKLESITIGEKVTVLEDGWCRLVKNLNKLEVDPKNKRYKNYENNFIIGKSDINSDTYDTLVFARRNIRIAKIPPFIKTIGDYAFELCKKLKHVHFHADSELQVIGKSAFHQSSIVNISIPRHVTEIGGYAFFQCSLLQMVDIPEDSELKTIGENAFGVTKIERFTFPPFATRIPNQAFMLCERLRSILFTENSQLRTIENNMNFGNPSINSIVFPPHLTQISDYFIYSYDLQIAEIDENSELQSINKEKFQNESTILMVPPKLVSYLK